MQKRFYVGLKTKNTDFTTCRLDSNGKVADVLWAMEKGNLDVVYLLHRFTDLTRDWFMSCAPYSLVTYNHEYRSGTYRTNDGRELSVRWAGSWFDFDPETVTVKDIKRAWDRLDYWLKKRSNGQIPAMSTPGQSGLRLLETCLPAGIEFKAPSNELCGIIRANTPQARKEILKNKIGDLTGDHFSYVDARWAYAACARIELPGELAVHYVADARANVPFAKLPFESRFWKGWVRAVVTAPKQWRGPGLVPVKLPSGRYSWPRDIFAEEVVITAREAEEAEKHGWRVDVLEAWKFTTVRPLRWWVEKLVEMRELEACYCITEPKATSYYRSAIRNVMLNAIGAMYSDTFTREGGVTLDEFADRSESMTRAQRLSAVRVGDQMRYVERVQKEGSLLNYYMPHWVAYIWAECRVRLAREMMLYNPDDLIGCNLDAIYVNGISNSEDDGKIGKFRLKGILRQDEIGELFSDPETPLDWNSIEALKEQAEASFAKLKGVAA